MMEKGGGYYKKGVFDQARGNTILYTAGGVALWVDLVVGACGSSFPIALVFSVQ